MMRGLVRLMKAETRSESLSEPTSPFCVALAVLVEAPPPFLAAADVVAAAPSLGRSCRALSAE
jgi:hypothetical protein